MRRRSWLSWLISIVVLAATSIACTALLGDYNTNGTTAGSEGGIPPGGCTDSQKQCNGNCVSKDDPVFGCAGVSCEPCNATTNAAQACKAGICSFACNQGFSDCDGVPQNGCEANSATDVANCGACGKTCGTTNSDGAPKCNAGKCVFTCKAGFDHCTGPKTEEGCETNLTNDKLNCGACGHSCLGGDCVASKCQPFQLASASFPSGIAVNQTDVYFTFPRSPRSSASSATESARPPRPVRRTSREPP